MVSQREARRIRNRADYERATQANVAQHPSHLKSLAKLGTPLEAVGTYAGNTLQEHLEDQMKKAVRTYRKCQEVVKAKAEELGPYVPLWEDSDYRKVAQREQTARGIIRGLATAILAYENSYNLGDMDAIKAIEKEFLRG